MKRIKLSEWAKLNGVHPKTAYTWYRNGTLGAKAEKVGARTILVEVEDDAPTPPQDSCVIYARVSSHDQKDDLDRQVSRLLEYAVEKSLKVTHIHKEISSGLNENRKILSKVLEDPSVKTILAERKDRIGRHNVNMIQSALKAQDRKIIYMHEQDTEESIVEDIISIMTSYASKIHGRRSAENRAQRAMKELQ